MEKSLEVTVNISDYLLTPLSCSSFVNTFFKGLLYQKTQIPYPYAWLKCSITRRRNREEPLELRGPDRFRIENQYRVASKLYDGLEDILNELANELRTNTVNEILILFGSTPLTPKEICRIKIPNLALGHFEQVHVKEAIKLQHNALRQIFLSDLWMDSIDSSIPCTNIYFYITKHSDDESSKFKACNPLNFQNNVKQYTIKLNPDLSKDYSCCRVYDENNEILENEDTTANSTEQEEKPLSWYQFDNRLEGYSNLYIEGIGVSDLW